MRLLLALSAVVLLSLDAAACGGSSKGMGSAVPASSDTARSSSGENAGGTDSNIPAYGHEASAADKRAVTALVKRYYAAAAAADGGVGCSLLYPALANSVPGAYGKPPGPAYARGKTCAAVMSKVFEHVRAQWSAADLAATKVTDVRIYRGNGFAELRSKAMPKGEIFVKRQDGSWRIGGLTGQERVGP